MRRVAILCASRPSAYSSIAGVDVYDSIRDARTFNGGCPVVAHPPCRGWSAYTAHQAKPEPGELELGIWCAEQVVACGGVLEQPAHSRLFAAASLPQPGEPERGGLWSTECWQAWWGYPMRKATWLMFSRIPLDSIYFPFRLHARGADRRRQQVMSKRQRAATCPSFAAWLVDMARHEIGLHNSDQTCDD